MSETDKVIQEFTSGEYKEGFVTDVVKLHLEKDILIRHLILGPCALANYPSAVIPYRFRRF